MQYHRKLEEELNEEAIHWVYNRVFRKDHQAPGFALITFGKAIGTGALRKNMVALKSGLAGRSMRAFGKELAYYWLARFDQQNTTRFHRDNAPRDAYLVLGYEPTAVESKLLFADHHQFVTENNLTSDEYYRRYNPLFQEGEEHLAPYTTELDPLDKQAYHILVINNSELDSQQTWGVLHKAVMKRPEKDQARIVNSMMLYLKPPEAPQQISPAAELNFLHTDKVNR